MTIANIPCRIRECQIDWLTCTDKSAGATSLLVNLGDLIKHKELMQDPTICDWRWRGYEGTRGEHFAYGSRWDGSILQLGGGLADEYFAKAHYRATHISRIDLAVTVEYDRVVEGVAADAYQQGITWNREHANGPERTLIVNGAGGSTTYIGSRTSDLFGRTYDKWRESGGDEYRNCWRWEVEFKGDIADRTSARLAASTERAVDIHGILSEYFLRRGVEARWMEVRRPLHVHTQRKASGLASRLAWLSATVRPVVNRLLPIVGEEGLRVALGLDPENVKRQAVIAATRLNGHHLGDGDAE